VEFVSNISDYLSLGVDVMAAVFACNITYKAVLCPNPEHIENDSSWYLAMNIIKHVKELERPLYGRPSNKHYGFK
jgi:hypothetical protein